MATTDVTRRGSRHPGVGNRTPSRNEDFFEEQELKELRDYVAPIRTARRVRLTLTTLVELWLVFGFDIGPKLSEELGDMGWFLQLLVIMAVLEVVFLAIRAPFGYWVTMVYEKKAGHSTSTIGTWIKDQGLEYLLSIFVGALLMGPAFAAIHAFPDTWWLVGGLAIVAFLIVVQFLAPVLIMPRFNKFTPLEPGPIRSRIEELAEKSGVKIQGVYLMDASKRTTRANAGVTGFGKTKRVIVNDTICQFPLEELSQVIAHELGHYRLNHIPKSFPVSALQFPLTLLFIDLVAGNETVLRWAGVLPPADLGHPASVPLFGFAFGIPLAITGLADAWLSRKHEREADLEALELLGDPTSFVGVWPRIVLADKANLEPTPWEKLKSTHPEIAERMQFGLDWAEMNDVSVTPPAKRSVPEPVLTEGSTAKG
ncbi:MAG TPA: M48 family metallopeptidase [Acidimicrobiales bacterium]|nr:M48 family metallopeptidase [Acidimicrobiales bacterium]